MKNIFLIIIGLIIIVSGVIYALNGKSQAKEDSNMDRKVLVAYFSATGTTKQVAQDLAGAINADIYEIKPQVPYTSADLNWMDKNSRSTLEMNDHNSRPEIVKDDFSTDSYDTIFLGFPIWWYIAPTIVNTFLEAHDLTNKKIILFATSGGSGFGRTVDNLLKSVSSSTQIKEGKLFNNHPNKEELKKWAEEVL